MAKHKFEKGHTYSTGRPKDSLSKRSLKFADAIMESGVDLVAELLGALNNAKKLHENAIEDHIKIAANNQIITAAEKMLPYLYPKLSSIEVKPNNPLANMSPQERLEAMKQAVLMLEKEVKTEVIEIGTTNMEDTKAKEAE